MRTQVKEPQIIILMLLSTFSSISAVLFTPALPAMAKNLGISDGLAQFAMTTFLIGYAFGNLPYGPFSNRYGRKPAIYVGILLAIVGSLIILLAGSLEIFWLLLLGRFLQALGSSVGLKVTFTMIGDVYSHTQSTKKISRIMLSFAISPGIAIALGGFLTTAFGWESCFYFLAIYSIFLFLLSLFLPETHKEVDFNALNIGKIKDGMLRQLKNTGLVTGAILMGCTTSCIYLFASEAPFIGINQIGLSEDIYGILNFIPPIGMILGSFFSHYLAGKEKISNIIFGGIVIILCGSVVMWLLFVLGFLSFWSLFGPVPFIYFGLTLVFSNASGLAMSYSKDKSYASAVMNFLNMSVPVLSLFLIQILPQKAFVLPVFFFFLSGLMLILRFIITKIKPASEIGH